jgi:clan AA aspartic protease
MWTFSVPVQILGPRGQAEVAALVDTGATHTLLPRNLLVELGVQPLERVAFELADERVVEYEIGGVRPRLDGRERTTVVVMGPEGATPLLGATTLEIFNLAVDPVRQRLIPVPGLLK